MLENLEKSVEYIRENKENFGVPDSEFDYLKEMDYEVTYKEF